MTKRQTRYTLEQKTAYVKQWETSGFPREHFARSVDINPKTFSSWTRSLATKSNSDIHLLPVDNAQAKPVHYHEQKSLKIYLPTGISLSVPFNDGELLTLIRGLML